MDAVVRDLLYAWRTLRRAPAFTAIAVLTLALGIGATTTMFAIVDGVLRRPLPSYREPGRLASVWVDFGVGGQSLPAMSAGDFRDYQQRTRALAGLAAGTGAQMVGAAGALTGDGGPPERVDVTPVTANFFPLLGVDPIYGRHFTSEEDVPGGAKVVMLGYGLWQRRYGGDPSIVGRRIRLDGVDQTVVGVLPRAFHLWLPAEAFVITDGQVWRPLQYDYRQQPPRNYTGFTVFARLNPGVTFAQAQDDMTRMARELRAEHRELEEGDMRVRLVPLEDDVVKHARRGILTLFGAVGLVLLIACANVAHLLLSRASAREREMAIRGALGATRARLLRQLAAESAVLAAAGCAAGVLLALFATDAIGGLQPATLPKLDAVHFDGAALAFAAAAAALTAILFGLAPALRAAAIDLNRTLRATAMAPGSSVGLRRGLMVGEMAIAIFLLVGAGLLIRSFSALQQVRPGFDPSTALTFRLALPLAKYGTPPLRLAFLRQMDAELRRLPGVRDVGYTSQLPLTGSGPLSPFAYDDATARNWESETSDGRNVSSGYFRAMGTRVLAGRAFDDHDTPQQNTIVIDETLAARAWPGDSAIGKRLQTGPTGTPNNFSEVIGVVEHIRAHDLTRAVRPQIYRPFGAGNRLSVVVRSDGDPASLAAGVESVMKALDPDLPLDRVQPMRAIVSGALARTRLALLVMTGFGAAALLLSCVGVYGVFSYAVSLRTREIGIRMALGQDRDSVRNQVLGEGLRLTAASIAIGLAAAALVSRSLAASLYQVRPIDPITFVATPLLLAAAALAGCYVPARRATRVDPLVALKSD